MGLSKSSLSESIQQTKQLLKKYYGVVFISVIFYLVLGSLILISHVTSITPEHIFIALIPFIAFLIESGRIEDMRFGDISVKLQDVVQQSVNEMSLINDIHDISEVAPPAVSQKDDPTGSRKNVSEVIPQRSLGNVSAVRFNLGGVYDTSAAMDLIQRNSRGNEEFEYIVITEDNGRFKGLILVSNFLKKAVSESSLDSPFNLLDGIDKFVNEIESRSILSNPTYMVTKYIDKESTIGEAWRRMENTHESYLPVVDYQDKFVGIIIKEDLQSQLLKSIGSKKRSR